jgi:hypothetical protein
MNGGFFVREAAIVKGELKTLSFSDQKPLGFGITFAGSPDKI